MKNPKSWSQFMTTEKCEVPSCGQDAVVVYKTIPYCQKHVDREKQLEKEVAAGAEQRVAEMRNNAATAVSAMPKLRRREDNINLQTDIFNSTIQSLPELHKEVMEDDSISKDRKNYAYMERLRARFDSLQSAIIERYAELQSLQSEQKAYQVTLNQLSQNITKEEREKLRIHDMNYQPSKLVTEKKPKAPKVTTSTKTAPMKEIVEVAEKYKLDAGLVKSFMNARKIGPTEACEILKASMTAAMNGSQTKSE